MSHSLPDILSLSGEATLLVQHGTIVFANTGARRLLGDCTGKNAAEVLGMDLNQTSARNYLADIRIEGESFTLRVSRLDEGRLVFLQRRENAPILLNDAFLYSLRSNLMTMGLAADKLRPAAEDLQLHGVLRDLTSLTAAYYKLMRLSENASLVRDLFEERAVAVPVELDMSLFCHAVLDAVEESLTELQFAREIQPSLHLNADPRLVKLLLFNLLSNCLCHADADFIQVRLNETAESVVLTVSDNGRGIPAEELHTAFERYRYANGPLEMNAGAGLGLTAARGAAQLHGGTLLLESRPDQGTSVRASFSKRLVPAACQTDGELCSMRDVLLGLADCLPLRFFEEKFLD